MLSNSDDIHILFFTITSTIYNQKRKWIPLDKPASLILKISIPTKLKGFAPLPLEIESGQWAMGNII